MFQSENEFVGWLRGVVRPQGNGILHGIGDDAAVVRVSTRHDLILTSDLSVEGVHFSRRLHPPRSVGHRALARSLSDVAAMGGRPRFALISFAISKQVTRRWLEEFFAGVSSLAVRHGVTLVGGDTSLVRGRMAVDVIAVGEVRAGRALLRSGARPGDLIFVSGRLGLAESGLRALKRRAVRPERRRQDSSAAIRAHLYPEPRCTLGQYLAEKKFVSAMMDISDGLSTDLARLCDASHVGARLWASRLPYPAVKPFERALLLALNGGEDYELLFTVSPLQAVRLPKVVRGVPIHQVGEICRARKLKLVLPAGNEIPIESAGYDHFRKE